MPEGSRRRVLRLVDANANRALEGLRVAEEVVRLGWNAPVYRKLRALRHAVAAAVRSLPASAAERASARDTRGDVGRRGRTSAAASLEQLLVINLQRAKESLRTLEECCRLFAPARAALFQSLRFQTYAIERALLIRLASVRDRGRRRGRRA